jgi:hypothetical protein
MYFRFVLLEIMSCWEVLHLFDECNATRLRRPWTCSFALGNRLLYQHILNATSHSPYKSKPSHRSKQPLTYLVPTVLDTTKQTQKRPSPQPSQSSFRRFQSLLHRPPILPILAPWREQTCHCFALIGRDERVFAIVALLSLDANAGGYRVYAASAHASNT